MERSLPYIMETTIKQIEDMSLNAWPSHKMELYDGWILRFSYLRSVPLSLLTLIMFWKTVDMPSSIPPMSWQ